MEEKRAEERGIQQGPEADVREEGRITDEDVERARFERNERRKMEIVLDGLKKGFTNPEIKVIDEDNPLTEQTVRTCRNKLVAQGLITEEEIQIARKKRRDEKKEKRKEEYVGPHDEEILRLTNLGFSLTDMEVIIGVGSSYISNRRRVLKDKDMMTEESIKEAKRNKDKKAAKRRAAISDMINFETDIDLGIVQDHIYYSKAMLHLGNLRKKDVNILSNAMQMDSRLITMGNVNFILTCYTREKNEDLALEFIEQCSMTVRESGEDQGKTDKLKEAGDRIKRKKERERIDKGNRSKLFDER